MAFIVNDRANPVPVTVVAPPPQTTAICTGVLGAAGGVAEFVNIAVRYPQSSFVCSGDVTSIDVSRIVFAPDLPSFFANVAAYRVTVADSDNASSPSEILAVLTDGTLTRPSYDPFALTPWVTGTSSL